MINKRESTGLCWDVPYHTGAKAPPEPEERVQEKLQLASITKKPLTGKEKMEHFTTTFLASISTGSHRERKAGGEGGGLDSRTQVHHTQLLTILR